MVNQENKGGFFARFRKDGVSGNESIGTKAPIPPAGQRPTPTPNVAPKPNPSLATSVVQTPVVAKPSSTPVTSEPVIDTVAAFSFLCNSLGDIVASQLKVVDMTLTMLSSSLNKIVDGMNPKE